MNQSYLKYYLRYDPISGQFFNGRTNQLLGITQTNGYVVIDINKKRYLAHRLAWLYMTGKWPRKTVDHKDRNPSNNKWENLREATQSQQEGNKRELQRNNKSGYRGVSKHSTANLWRATITVESKQRHLGYFKTREEASKAYKEAAKKHFGEFYNADL